MKNIFLWSCFAILPVADPGFDLGGGTWTLSTGGGLKIIESVDD